MTRRPLPFAWFAGVDLRLLASAPSEWVFYDTLGLVVLLISCASGLSLCLAVSYVLGVSPTSIWWIGAAWALMMSCGVERLMMQVTARSWRWLIVSLIPRVALSLVLALGMEPLVLGLNGREINSYISDQATAALRSARASASAAYVPRIEGDYRQISAIRAHENQLSEGVDHYRFLESCESDTPSCSVTHLPSCGSYCEHDAHEAQRLQGELYAAEPEDRARIDALTGDINALQRAGGEDEQRSHMAVSENSGLAARLEALSAIETKHSIVFWEVWLFRVLFVIIDLLPLTMRVTRMLSIDCAPYEAACRAARRDDAVDALELDRSADVRETEVEEQSKADKDVARTRIWAERDQRVADIYNEPDAGPGERPPPRAKPQLLAWDLKTFAANMTAHEARPVTVPLALRRGGIVGLASLCGLALLTGVLSSTTHCHVAGAWLIWASLALVGALAIRTRGFRHARTWALRAIFAALPLGLVLPIFITTLNL